MMDKELLDELCVETLQLCEELESILDEYDEDESFSAELEKFGQTVDRIMGAAKSLGVKRLGLFSEMAKIISYKASQTESKELVNLVVATLADCVDILVALAKNLKSNGNEELSGVNLEAFSKRMHWLSDKFKHIDRASVAFDASDEELDDLLDEI